MCRSIFGVVAAAAAASALHAQQIQTTVTLPDGTQAQATGTVQGGIVGGLVGGIPANPQAARDARPATGDSTIRGRVIVADTGQPARRASVRLAFVQARESRMTTTDIDGRYEFDSLPAAAYYLNAGQNGFVGLSYGQTSQSMPQQMLTLGNGQVANDINLFLLRGGVIAGRVLDDFGDPLSGVTVVAMRRQFQQGQARLLPGPRATTNDIGEYRLFALSPGAYYVVATPPARPTIAVNEVPAVSDERHSFAAVFHPGTTDPASAAKITVVSGQTVYDVNLSLMGARLSQISGLAVDSKGQPLAGGLVMANRRGPVVGLQDYSSQMRPDGSFTIRNVPPGEYTLRASVVPAAVRMPMTPAGTPGVFVAPPGTPVASVTVQGDDIGGVLLAPVQSVLASGRVVFDDPAAAAAVRPANIRISAQRLDPDDGLNIGPGDGFGPMTITGLGLARLKEDFIFELQIAPGTVILRPTVMPTPGSGPWMLKAMRVNGVDATNTGVAVRPGENLSGVELELTNHIPEISGVVTNARGEPAANQNVIVFPQDTGLWSLLPGPGLAGTARSDQSGKFTLRTLRPGRYYAVALYETDRSGWTDPEYLQTIVARATAFSLADGEKKTLDLRGQVQP